MTANSLDAAKSAPANTLDAVIRVPAKAAINVSNLCISCKKSLCADEKALNLKLISRTVTTFYCLDCLAEKLGCNREALEERIRYYRESGNCTLFR